MERPVIKNRVGRRHGAGSRRGDSSHLSHVGQRAPAPRHLRHFAIALSVLFCAAGAASPAWAEAGSCRGLNGSVNGINAVVPPRVVGSKTISINADDNDVVTWQFVSDATGQVASYGLGSNVVFFAGGLNAITRSAFLTAPQGGVRSVSYFVDNTASPNPVTITVTASCSGLAPSSDEAANAVDTAVQNVVGMGNVGNATESFGYRGSLDYRGLLDLAVEYRQGVRRAIELADRLEKLNKDKKELEQNLDPNRLRGLRQNVKELNQEIDNLENKIGAAEKKKRPLFEQSNKLILEARKLVQDAGLEPTGYDVAESVSDLESTIDAFGRNPVDDAILRDGHRVGSEVFDQLSNIDDTIKETTKSFYEQMGVIDDLNRDVGTERDAILVLSNQIDDVTNSSSKELDKINAEIEAIEKEMGPLVEKIEAVEDQLEARKAPVGLDLLQFTGKTNDRVLAGLGPDEAFSTGNFRVDLASLQQMSIRGALSERLALGPITSPSELDAFFFDLLRPRRFNAWLGGNVSGFDDDSSGGTDGFLYSVAGGASYLLTPDVTLAVAGRYRRADSDNGTFSHDGDFFSGALIATFQLFDQVTLDTIASYEHGDNDVTLGVGTGNFDTDTYSIGGGLHDRFWLDNGLWIEPNLNLSYSWTDREAFTDSVGLTVPESDISQGLLSGGPTAGILLPIGSDFLRSVEPYGSAEAVWEFKRDLGDERFGVALEGGLSFNFSNSISVTASGGYFGLGTDFQSWSANAVLSIPLN